MRVGPIDNNSITPGPKVNKLTPATERLQTRPAGDQISLSQNMQLAQALSKALEKVPDVREQQVAAVKQKLASDDYQIDSNQIARRIVEQLTLLEGLEETRGNYRAAA